LETTTRSAPTFGTKFTGSVVGGVVVVVVVLVVDVLGVDVLVLVVVVLVGGTAIVGSLDVVGGGVVVGSLGTSVVDVVGGGVVVGSVGAGVFTDVVDVELVEGSDGIPPTTGVEVVTTIDVDGSAPSGLDVCSGADVIVFVEHVDPVATTGPATVSAIPMATAATSTVGRRLRRPIQSAPAPASTTAAATMRSG
jgi:hypothetical protein